MRLGGKCVKQLCDKYLLNECIQRILVFHIVSTNWTNPTIYPPQVVLALAVKYLFYEDWEENCRIRKTYLEELERKCVEEASESDSVSVDTNTSERYLLLSIA